MRQHGVNSEGRDTERAGEPIDAGKQNFAGKSWQVEESRSEASLVCQQGEETEGDGDQVSGHMVC